MSKHKTLKNFKALMIVVSLGLFCLFLALLLKTGYFLPKDAKPVSDAEKTLFLEGDVFSYSLNIPFKACGNSSFQDVNLYVSNNDAYLLLPAYADLSKLRYHKVNSFYTVALDEKILKNNSLVNITPDDSSHTLIITGKEVTPNRTREKVRKYQLHILKSENLPAVFINTASGSLDIINESKEFSEKGTLISIDENGNIINLSDLEEIKGRGQISFTYPKRPYSLKFKEDTDLLGMGLSKSYIIQGNWFDPSRLRNATALSIAKALDMPFTSDYKFIDLYFNGNYYGNYLIEEPIEISKDRISIDKSKDLLFEIVYLPERLDPLRINYTNPYSGYPWEIKYPKASKLDKASADLAFEQICKTNGLIYSFNENTSEDTPDLVRDTDKENYDELCKLINIDTFVNGYIFDYLVDNVDTGRASTYYTYDADKKLISYGPVWDFDKSMGIETKCENPANFSIYFETLNSPLIQNSVIRQLIYDKFTQNESELKQIINTKIKEMADTNNSSMVMDHIVWPEYHGKTADKGSYQANTDYLISFMNNRYELLKDSLLHPDEYVNVYINDMNGRFYTLKKGDTIPKDSIEQMIFFSQCKELICEDGQVLDSNIQINKDMIVTAAGTYEK